MNVVSSMNGRMNGAQFCAFWVAVAAEIASGYFRRACS